MASTQRHKPVPNRKPGNEAKSQQTSANAAAAPTAAVSPQRSSPGDQTRVFDRAIAALHARKFADAAALFRAAAEGPNAGMAHSARLHLRICEQRIAALNAKPETPEELYNFAIALINQRKLADAEKHLKQALQQAPKGDHLHYALALCRGLAGDMEGSRDHLRRAIELDPRNRLAARNDPDFAEIAQYPIIAELLYSGITRS